MDYKVCLLIVGSKGRSLEASFADILGPVLIKSPFERMLDSLRNNTFQGRIYQCAQKNVLV